MKITYVGHSCFSVEMDDVVLIFDYYKGDLNNFSLDKTIYVFISHKHKDHFNPEIFELANTYPHIHFIISNDCKMNEKYMERLHVPMKARDKIRYIGKNQELEVDSLQIHTLKSTDEGVAFIINTNGIKLYHAGDLNWWSWQGESEEEYQDMTNRFVYEINKLQGEHFDIAFLPLDPRQEDRFWWGFDYFMKATDTTLAFPMHFWNKFSTINKFLQMDCVSSYKDKIIKIAKKEESFEV